ncbi:MAG: hypothetical protein HY811_01110 [Planctomycetes bacterium]|nr:hypothetical protein [Planctomycetota bacterium]
MNIQCPKCGRQNEIPDNCKASSYACYNCRKPLGSPKSGENSAAVGLIGGALLGASIGGPIGAIVGGIFGAILGSEAKGLDK